MSFIRRILEVVIGTVLALFIMSEIALAAPYQIGDKICESDNVEFIFLHTKDPNLQRRGVHYAMNECLTKNKENPCLSGIVETQPRRLTIAGKAALPTAVLPRKGPNTKFTDKETKA